MVQVDRSKWFLPLAVTIFGCECPLMAQPITAQTPIQSEIQIPEPNQLRSNQLPQQQTLEPNSDPTVYLLSRPPSDTATGSLLPLPSVATRAWAGNRDFCSEPLVLSKPTSNLAQVNSNSSVTPTPAQISPLALPMNSLFGFETGSTLGANQLILNFGGGTFKNPQDIRQVELGTANRSNDAHVVVTYGISDTLQVSAGLTGKDDTIFSNLVNSNSHVQILNNSIPLQVKWKYRQDNQVQASLLAGLEFSNPFAALFFRQDRSIEYSQPSPTVPNLRDRLVANDFTPYLSFAAPISYQATENLSLHLNPQVSFLPNKLAVTTSTGNLNNLRNAGIGFDGQQLNYYGTVIGVGLGTSYRITPSLQIAADFTPIISGKNSLNRGGNNSLFIARPVWNIGLQYAFNNRTAMSLYASNRLSSTAASPANLLVQPGGDSSVGFSISYLPDLGSNYQLNNRSTYPPTKDLLTSATGYPSSTLPIGSIAYQLGIGGRGINPSVRIGLLDDLEFAISHNNTTRRESQMESSAIVRFAIAPDRGQEGLSAALDLGLTRVDGPKLLLGYSLYADAPVSYRLPGNSLTLSATPKVVIPAQFQGVSTIAGLALGASFQVAENTELLGQVTPIFVGQNQLVANESLNFQGRSPVYSLGIRRLFPTGNSTYGVELYYSNAAGNTGFQSVSKLPNGESQFGVRFSILNGTK